MTLAIGLLLVRLVIGLGLAAHGAQKLFGWFGGYGIAGTGGYFESLGWRPGKFFAAAAGFAEFVGGLLIALGFLGAIGPMLILATMVVAIVAVHLKNGFFAQGGGIEVPLVYAAAAFGTIFGGFGSLSLDAALGITALTQPAVVWGLLALGIIGGLANAALRRPPQQVQAPSGS